MKAIVKNNFEFEGQKGHYVGKVRDVYNINDDYLVMVVSDRISAFDVRPGSMTRIRISR